MWAKGDSITMKVTHYFLKGTPPFKNILNQSLSKQAEIISNISVNHSTKRVFGSKYLQLRKKTEEKLKDLFIKNGGRPEVNHPSYFVLGESNWFKGLSDSHQKIEIPLDQLDTLLVSITYPDSFVSMGFMPEFGMTVEEMPYHNKVFKVEDTPSLIKNYGLPKDEGKYENYQNKSFEKYIEVQYWGKVQDLKKWRLNSMSI